MTTKVDSSSLNVDEGSGIGIVCYLESKKNALDLLLSLPERLDFLIKCYKENPDDIHEVINIITNMYFFSNTSGLKNYMIAICSQRELPIILRLECAKNVTEESWNLIHDIFKQEEPSIDKLETPTKIENVIFYMQSQVEIHQQNALKYFLKLIGDHKIEDIVRLKVIQSLEGKIQTPEVFKHYTQVSTLHYIADKINSDNFRIVACQYILEKNPENITSDLREYTPTRYLLEIAESELLDEDTRADACDILLKYIIQPENQSEKEKVEKILFILAGGETSRRNIFKNKQNVHMKSISDSVEKILEKIILFKKPGICTPSITQVIRGECIENVIEDFPQIQDELSKHVKTSEELEMLLGAMDRISIDRATYGSKNMTLKSILIKVWIFIKYSESLKNCREEVEKRLAEEIIDSKGKCSSGFTSRLLNSLSGFDENMTITISFKDQIIANLEGRLSSKLKNVKNDIFRKKNAYEDMKESDFETEDELYMSRILEEMTLDTSKFDKRSNFLKFFREHISSIREDMYQEFKSFMLDEDYDAYFRDAILHYEGS